MKGELSARTGLQIRIGQSVGACDAVAWDHLGGGGNPFVSHAFLSALEDSKSVGERTGWLPLPILLEQSDGALLGALPAYVKLHSQGEYVFDHAWADAWQRAGGHYYPKLQVSVPFTPVSGPRVLTRDPALILPLLQAAEQLTQDQAFSSLHSTFIEPGQVEFFESAGWMLRHDTQFHWDNAGYTCFDDFLADLSSSKRKNIRKERLAAQAGLRIEALTGDALKSHHWDVFWTFYQNTGARKWGTPYLTREAFTLLQERMADKILLVLAYEGGEAIAGALNFMGADTLYGRYWGALVDRPYLHFELCYYQAIDHAIQRGLRRVEAGAQGEHKLARGYRPVRTVSAHYIPNKDFRSAVSDYLAYERVAIAQNQQDLDLKNPFRKAE